ncbi:MAG: hypothetical protein ACRCXH_06965 [Shewanella sp.]
MGLLNGGVNRIMGRGFAAFYLDGMLINKSLVDDGAGTITEGLGAPISIKYQLESVTEAQRSAPDYRATDVRVLILDTGFTINSDSLLDFGADRYRVAPGITRDPAKAYYDVRAVLQ